MTSNYVLGPIDSGASFMFVTLINDVPNVLKFSSFNGLNIYYWESALTTFASNVSVFMAHGNPNNVTIMSTNPPGYIGISGGVNLVNSSSPLHLNVSQSAFANWNSPTLFLSDIEYSIKTLGGTGTMIYTDSQGGNPIPANNIFVLPILFYTVCTSSTHEGFTSAPASLNNWLCNQTWSQTHSDYASYCQQFPILPPGWDNLSDCRTGKIYTYCPTGSNCGTDNCKGPCPNSAVCAFTDTYTCKQEPITGWWKSHYFIAIIIGFTILFILFILLLFVANRKRKKRQLNT